MRSLTLLGFAWTCLSCSSGHASPNAAAGSGAAGATSEAGTSGAAGAKLQAGSSGAAGAQSQAGSTSRCEDNALTWKTANKTNYTSYPAPGSEECVKFSGCEYEGQFAACDAVKSEAWVSRHAIVAIFPNLRSYQLHDLCLSKPDGSKKLVVTVYDTCADSDCDGCCTENKGSADALIDVEHYTNERWGVEDGPIRWADLGPTTGEACEGN